MARKRENEEDKKKIDNIYVIKKKNKTDQIERVNWRKKQYQGGSFKRNQMHKIVFLSVWAKIGINNRFDQSCVY